MPSSKEEGPGERACCEKMGISHHGGFGSHQRRMATLGYGDIVPVNPIVRMLVILEGVAGQLFPAILIARLVSLQVQSKQKT